MKFAYVGREIDPLPGEVGPELAYDPDVVVRVVGPAAAWLIPGIVDTGARDTLIPMRYLERLGIEKGPASP